jgi:hypothetical protein
LLEVQAVRAQQAVPAQETSLLECVHPDVVTGLLFSSSNSNPTPTVVYDKLPEDMMGVVTPPDFDLIGGLVRDVSAFGVPGLMRDVTASFRTDLDPAAAEAAAAAALSDSGWEWGQIDSAFVADNPIFAMQARSFFGDRACRDGKSIRVSAYAVDGINYVDYAMQVGAQALMCGPADSASSLSGAQRAPRLSLPPGARSGGSGRTGTQSRMEIRYSGSLAELTQFMAQQLVDQGWSNDARWSGSTTAGSSWVKNFEDGMRAAGTLDVTATDQLNYEMLFRLVLLQ